MTEAVQPEDVAAKSRALYDLGKTAIFACAFDPRFHYCLYVPPAAGQGAKLDLLVAVHGSSRTSFLEFRDGFAAFGRWN
ncbi:MAG TPA: alpha/beta hydrolase, partial [Rhodopila sp.]